MNRALLLALTLVAAPATAQLPAEKPPEQPKAERPALNLRLENPSSFATTAPADKEAAKGLPALGGDARQVVPPRREGSRPTPGGPFPKDTNPNL